MTLSPRHALAALLCLVLVTPAAAQFATGFGGTGFVVPTYNGSIGPDGTTYVAGGFSSSIAIDPGNPLVSEGSRDVFVGAFDDAGLPLWSFSVGDNGSDLGSQIVAAPDGDVCVSGWFEGAVDFDPGAGELILQSSGSPGAYTVGGFLARYRPDGTPVYARVLQGGNAIQTAQSVLTDAEGRCVVGGEFIGTLDLGGGVAFTSDNSRDVYIVRFENDGTAGFGIHVTSPVQMSINAIDRGAGGRICATGMFAGPTAFGPGPDDTLTSELYAGYVACYTADGAFEFARSVSGPTNSSVVTSDVAVDPDGRPVLVGRFFDEATIEGETFTSAGLSDAFVAAYDADGAGRFAFAFGGGGMDWARGVGTDADGHVYVAGSFAETVDFDPGSGTAAASADDVDVFVARYAPGGALVEVQTGSGPGEDEATALDVAPDGTVGVFGIYRENVTLPTGDAMVTLTPFASGTGAFVLRTRFDGAVSAEAAPAARLALTVAPNPSAGAATARLALDVSGTARVTVHDALGRAVGVLHDGALGAGDHAFRLPALAPGLYVVRAVTADGAASRTLSIAR